MSATNVCTLDLATFTPPPGWQVEARGSGPGEHVVVSKSLAGTYCAAAVFHSADAGVNLEASFASEWARVALATIDPVATPRSAISEVGPLRVAVGGAASTARGQPIMGLLFVVDAGARVVSILTVSPSFASLEPYRVELDTILGTLAVRRVESVSDIRQPSVARPTLTIADLAGDWGRNDGINTRYVDAHTGTYAGTDSIHFTETWQIAADGTIALDFFAIHNGRRITEAARGTVTLSADGILVIRKPNEQRFVLRGWETAGDTTVMTLNGPWYDSIPADVIANPAIGFNLDQRWVRRPR